MQRQFLFLVILLLYAPARAQFIEQFRSEPNQRLGKILQSVLLDEPDDCDTTGLCFSAVRDMNRNGISDRATLESDGQGGVVLLVFDGLAPTPMWRFPLTQKLGLTDLDYLGFFNFKGNGTVSAMMLDGKGNDVLTEEVVVCIVDPSTNAVEYQAEQARFFDVANVEFDAQPEIIYGDLTTRQIVVVGWQDGGSHSQMSSATPTASPASILKSTAGYPLIKKYASGAGYHLAFAPAWFERVSDLDLEGDNRMDLVITVENPSGDPLGLIVRDGATHAIKWQFPFPAAHREDLVRGFHGFFDVDGNGEKEALFGRRTVVTLNGAVQTLDANFEILAVTDVDNDRLPDLVGRGVADSSVQVWGVQKTTSVTEENLMIAGFQLYQNYPNPFNPSTAISYSVAQAGDVALTIFNALGQAVRTLVNERKLAGEYTLSWDGRDDAGRMLSTGSYFYRLQAGDAIQTRTMLFLK